MSGESAEVRSLPRGRHHLTREQVTASQRGRLLEAMGECVAAKGYVRTSVADVLKRAGVSRRTFYENFTDKEDCFLAAYGLGVDLLIAGVAESMGDLNDSPIEQFGRGLAAYLETLAEEPTLARAGLIEVYAAGPRVLARRHEVQQRFVDITAALFGATEPEDRFAVEALVGALSSLVTTRIGVGQVAELPKLHEPIMKLVKRHWGDA